MSRTITALFDTRADAEAAAERLRLAGIDAGDVNVHDRSTDAVGENSTREHRGIWASIKHALLPDEDRHTYEEGVRRGGVLLTADVDDDRTAAAVEALEAADAIDLDERASTWRDDGWDYAATREEPAFGADTDEIGRFGTRDTAYNSGRYRSYVGNPD